LVAIDMFNADARCAATYLAMETSSMMHRAWLQSKLTRLNLPSSMYPTLDQPSSSGFPSGSFWYVSVCCSICILLPVCCYLYWQCWNVFDTTIRKYFHWQKKQASTM
jgi:hypothetical protein